MSEPFTEQAVTHPRTIPGVAIALSTLVAYLFARGIIAVADLFCRALFGTVTNKVAWIPWLGKKFDHGLDSVKTRVINYLGYAAGKLDHGIATSWHGLAQVFEELGNEIAWQAAALAALAFYVTKTIGAAAIGPRIKITMREQTHARQTLKKVQAQTSAVTRAVAHPRSGPIGAAIHVATRSVAADVAGLRNWTLPRVKTLEREVGVAIPHTIEGLRARTRAVERRVEVATSRLRGLTRATAGIGAAALVATALGRLGAGWIRCSNWNKLGRGICRAPAHLIDDLLALATDFFVLTNICTILPWLETAASDIAGPLIGTLGRVGAGVCRSASGPDAALVTPALHLPAATGAPTLHLP